MNKCPECGSGLLMLDSMGSVFKCGTLLPADSGVADQGQDCLRNQLTAWKAYAERLEVAGERLTGCANPTGCDVFNWTKAKETKP